MRRDGGGRRPLNDMQFFSRALVFRQPAGQRTQASRDKIGLHVDIDNDIADVNNIYTGQAQNVSMNSHFNYRFVKVDRELLDER